MNDKLEWYVTWIWRSLVGIVLLLIAIKVS